MFVIIAQRHREGLELNLPRRAVIDGENVGGWLINQRAAFKKGTLSAERVARLEAVGIRLNTDNKRKGLRNGHVEKD
jgi:hypothetical protein